MKFNVVESVHKIIQFSKGKLSLDSRNSVILFSIPITLVCDTVNSFAFDGIEGLRVPRSNFL